ncbi:MAG TPA: hypothetical protein PLK61_04005 [Nitrosomonas sp.]|nr:hypothetical protein [Nitrosomonas sp.]
MQQNEEDALLRFVVKSFVGISSAVLVALLGWIAHQVADIPVIQRDISAIRSTMDRQLDDHERRIRYLEKIPNT